MKELSGLLKKLADEMKDLFAFLGEEGERYFPKLRREGEEGDFVVETIAYYDSHLKKIFFCEKNFLDSVRTYGISEKFIRAFALYVLLHEFTHYALDLLGFQDSFHNVPINLRFDEPFCEYIALRACVNGRLTLFDYERELAISEDEKELLPILSSIPRPAPYRYFKEIYARPENLLGEPAEITFLRLKHALSKIDIPMDNPNQNAIFRLLLISQPIPKKEIYRQNLKRKIRAVGVVNASLSLRRDF